MILDIREFTASEIASGSINGKWAFSKMIPLVSRSIEPQLLCLDFSNITVATSSFLRETVLGIRNYCYSSNNNLYPIVVNANTEVAEELNSLLTSVSDAMVCCLLDKAKFCNIQLIGFLEDKQKLTYQAVVEFKEIDAIGLSQKFESENIGVTGWNNRLASLAAKGLIIEIKKGRSKFYRPIMEAKYNGE